MKFLKYILLSFACFLALAATAQTDRTFVRRGNRLYRQQTFDKAEVEYRKALSKNPSNPQALYNLGCALMMQNKDSAAILQYENAAKMEQVKIRKAKVYHNMGVICQRHQMFGEAIKAYEESLRNNPSDDETRYNLALCKRQQKQQQQQGGGQKDKEKNNQNKDKDKQQKQQQDKKEQTSTQQPREQMSKENAEQLLNAAMQEEKATQQRMKEKMRRPQRRQLQKNW